MKTVLYARYSSALQNSQSAEDQLRVLRERCAREDWEIVGEYADLEVSGAAGLGHNARPQLYALLEQLEAGGVDQLLTEATDRASRHVRDTHEIFERIKFAGARWLTLHNGEVTELYVSMMGIVDSMFRSNLREKVKRGQHACVRDGRFAAGLAYGYSSIEKTNGQGNPVRGLREPDPVQASIIQRIFEEYREGLSPKMIAERLNSEGILSPLGGQWVATTISGDKKRKNGILHNRLYLGMLIHNRTSKIQEPMSRKQHIRPNPESEWIIENIPRLRIISDELWQDVHDRMEQRANRPFSKQHRPKRLLSELAICGVCGGRWIVIGAERWGCSSHRNGKACTNNRTITTERFEERVLSGLQQRMLDPQLVNTFVAEYHAEFARRSAQQQRENSQLEKKLADANSKIARLVNAIAEGGEEFAEIKEALCVAREQRDRLQHDLQEAKAGDVIMLHPKIAETYQQQVAQLTTALTFDDETRLKTHSIIRRLIDQVIIRPSDAERGVIIEVSGRLASILALATGEELPAAMYAAAGAGEGIRTLDPDLGKVVLYH
jgi:site-specific DNA recombinase